MESGRVSAPQPPSLGSIVRTVTKILSFQRRTASSAGGAAGGQEDRVHKFKLSQNLGEYYSGVHSDAPGSDFRKPEHGKQLKKKAAATSSMDREAMESLLANLFASISAIKASYAQLQIAQSPYDPDSIQSSDFAIVTELKRLSELKRSYLKKHFEPNSAGEQPAAIAAQIEEQHNLIKTYQITANKLERELELKDKEILSLQGEFSESEKKNRAFETKLQPGRSLSALDDPHLSGLNPTHFLVALRFAYKSIKSFVKLMEKEMVSAGWDLDAAACAIQQDILQRKKPAHRTYAFQSFVCQKMFSDFHHKSFNLDSLEHRSTWDRRQFFDEFTELKSTAAKWKPGSSHHQSPAKTALVKFYREKYLTMMHPKMESSFFGNLELRAAVSSGQCFPDGEFFAGFTEMARRVWLLHCLFFSFETEAERSIFQVRPGSRFSEVYMDSVTEEEEDGGARSPARLRPPTVGFTVVPGFRVGRMLIQCKVYLSSDAAGDNRR